MRSQLLVLALVTSALSLGCGRIRLRTTDVHDTVIERKPEVVSGHGVQVDASLEGSEVHIASVEACAIVEMNRIRRVEHREPNDDPTEELVVLGFGAVPLGIGIAMLADAQNVYEDDRNARLYNSSGPSGAIIGGTILVAVGGLLTILPTVQLLRVAAAGEVRERMLVKPGSVVRENVPCEQEPVAVDVRVQIRIGPQTYSLPDAEPKRGQFRTDLADSIPVRALRPAQLERYPTGKLIVDDKALMDVDLLPIADESLRRRDERAWQRAKKLCEQAKEADVKSRCAGVELYLQGFPNGLYRDDAQRLLNQRLGPPATIAGVPGAEANRPSDGEKVEPPPEPLDPATQRAVDRAKKEHERALKRCEQTCLRGCKRDGACAQRCAQEACK